MRLRGQLGRGGDLGRNVQELLACMRGGLEGEPSWEKVASIEVIEGDDDPSRDSQSTCISKVSINAFLVPRLGSAEEGFAKICVIKHVVAPHLYNVEVW